jgi:hypothetical protein
VPQPPTAEHPPPAPDWILGDDGHWKPPPFSTGGGPRPAPAAGPNPPSGGAPGRGGTGQGSRWGALAGLLVPILFIGGIGFKAYDAFEVGKKVFGSDDAPVDERAAALDAQADDLADDMDSRARTVLGPDGDRVCPAVEWVGPLTDDRWPVPPEIVREGVDRSVNDVDVSGIECRYGEHIRVGKLDGFEDRVHELMSASGPVAVREGPFPGSVRFDDPATGTATIVFEDRDETVEAFVQLPIDGDSYLISLADFALN